MTESDELRILRVKAESQAYEIERLRAEMKAVVENYERICDGYHNAIRKLVEERGTCQNLDRSGYGFKCSECGHARTQSGEIDPTEWNCCPNCGKRVVES